MNSLFLSDGYKYGHQDQYPKGTTLVYSNFTPRTNRHAPTGCEELVVFGTQAGIQKLHEDFQYNFFGRSKEVVIKEIKDTMTSYLGVPYNTRHFEQLHDLGYLPIRIKALPEGSVVGMKTPVLTIVNTEPEFYWITNFLESILSNMLWKPMTSASIAYGYRKLLNKYAEETDKGNLGFVDWQAHDFSFRGMDSVDAVTMSGMGHLTSFKGTDSLPAVWGVKKYYFTDNVAGSVPATEHSVMCAGSKEGELQTFARLLDTYKDYPVLSVVSDTWDLWNVITNILPQLKNKILSGNTKLVIRPDSGDPVDILCGRKILTLSEASEYFNAQYLSDLDEVYISHEGKIYDPYIKTYPDGMVWDIKLEREVNEPEAKGVIELLWDLFGGTINEQGYKVLDPHIGAIYGDSITIARAQEICERLKAKGFASTNVVLGIGSFTYQYNTRDTYGFAMKATYVEKLELFPEEGAKCPGPCTEIVVGHAIFKDPVTDDGTKKSATGLLKVYKEDGVFKLKDKCTWEEESEGELKLLYEDGIFKSLTTFTNIQNTLWPKN